MTFPTGLTISTANLSSPDGDPSLARVELYQLVAAFNELVASVDSALGIPLLDAGGKLNPSQLPSTITSTGTITVTPGTKIVNIRDVLRLTQRFVDDNGQLSNAAAGDIIYLVDGDAGRPCLSVFDGTIWRVVRLATQVGSVGAAWTSTFTLEAEADL